MHIHGSNTQLRDIWWNGLQGDGELRWDVNEEKMVYDGDWGNFQLNHWQDDQLMVEMLIATWKTIKLKPYGMSLLNN